MNDCAVLAAALPASANIDSVGCCQNSGFVECDGNGRIIKLNMFCTTGGQPWVGQGFPSGISGLNALQVLFLDDCGMNGPVPDIWGNFPSLYELHLGSNMQEGNITGANSNLGNHFEGPLPPSMGQLASMSFFHIENNAFTGDVPQSLSDLITSKICGADNPCYFEFEGNCLTNVPKGNATSNVNVMDKQRNSCQSTLATSANGASVSKSTSVPPASLISVIPTVTTTLSVGTVKEMLAQSSSLSPTLVAILPSTGSSIYSSPSPIETATTLPLQGTSTDTTAAPTVPIIIGGCIGALLLILVGISCCCAKRKAAKSVNKSLQYDQKENSYELTVENPRYVEKDYFEDPDQFQYSGYYRPDAQTGANRDYHRRDRYDSQISYAQSGLTTTPYNAQRSYS